MPTSYLSILLSSIALCITTAKFSISVWRQYHEYTWNSMSTTKTKLWLQMAMSVVLLIFSGLLLAFACKEEEKALCTLLSLAEVFMIIYQGIFLSLYCVTCPRWFRWPSLVVFIIYCVTLLILSALIGTAGYATTLKNILLASFVAGYLLIDVAYLLAFHLRQGGEGDVHFHFLWNIGLCCIVWLGTLASFICYSNVEIDFLTSLWIDNAVALVPIVWMLYLQSIALKKTWHTRPSSLVSCA